MDDPNKWITNRHRPEKTEVSMHSEAKPERGVFTNVMIAQKFENEV